MENYKGTDRTRDGGYVQLAIGSRLDQMQRVLILATLRHCAGNKTRAAAMLGISLKTLYNRLNEYSAEPRTDAQPSSAGASATPACPGP